MGGEEKVYVLPGDGDGVRLLRKQVRTMRSHRYVQSTFTAWHPIGSPHELVVGPPMNTSNGQGDSYRMTAALWPRSSPLLCM